MDQMCDQTGTLPQEQADRTELQRQTGQPWSRKWNWLLDKPDKVGVTGRGFLAGTLLFNGVVVGVLRLTPVWGPPTSLVELVVGLLAVLLLPVGLVWAWSAFQLHRLLRARTSP